MVTTDTPFGRISTRSASRYFCAADFDALYAPEPGNPRMPATLAMPTSVPCRSSTMRATNGSNVAIIPK